MTDPFDTALRERIAQLPADPPTGWASDLRARLASAWEADDLETAASAAVVVDLQARPRRRSRLLWLAATATAAAAVAAAVLNLDGPNQEVTSEVPPLSVTVPARSLPSNGKLVLSDRSGTPRLMDTDGRTSTPIPCAEPCPGGAESLWQITNGDVWSPDNKRVAYLWNYGIYVLDAESGVTRRVAGPCAGTGQVTMWDGTLTGAPPPVPTGWSPDGSRILYECRGLHIVSLTDSRDVLIADACELLSVGCEGRWPDYYYISGLWSPDGRSIAVTLEDPPAHTSALHIVDATTGSHRLVASQGEAVAWAPDGRLAYWRGDDELRSIDANGLDSLIANAPRGEVAPNLAHVAYITDYHEGRAEGADVRVRDLVSGEDVLIERGEHRYEGVEWSPDGTRLAISSNERLVIVNPDGSLRVTLPQTERGGLAWLPLPKQ